jgi:hypothetical protein
LETKMSTKLNVAQRKEAQEIISFATNKHALTEAIYKLIKGRDAAYDKGEDMGWAATKMLWDRMGEWQKEWQAEVPKERASCFNDALELVEWKIAAARAEGAEQERERIRKEAVDEHWGSIGEDVRRICTVPVSVLDPPEGTTERRTLTWEEYDNLFRGTTSDDPASLLSLAPKEEK